MQPDNEHKNFDVIGFGLKSQASSGHGGDARSSGDAQAGAGAGALASEQPRVRYGLDERTPSAPRACKSCRAD